MIGSYNGSGFQFPFKVCLLKPVPDLFRSAGMLMARIRKRNSLGRRRRMATTGSSSRTSRWWIIGAGLLLGPLCLCGLCASGIGATLLATILRTIKSVQSEARSAQEAAEQFLSALRDARWESAYAWCAPRFQEELGGPDRLARYGGALQPTQWSFHSWNIQSESGVRRAAWGNTGRGERRDSFL